MEDTTQYTRVVKMTMPRKQADDFIKDSLEKYGDVRWIAVMFHKQMYEALYSKQPEEVKQRIEEIRLEINDKIKEYYQNLKQNR